MSSENNLKNYTDEELIEELRNRGYKVEVDKDTTEVEDFLSQI